MLKFIAAALLIAVGVSTLGYLAAGQICFLMGFPNIPGFKIWRAARAHRSATGQWLGVISGWLGQAIVGVGFALLLVRLARLIFSYVAITSGVHWLIWIAFFLLASGPLIETRHVSWDLSEDEGRTYYALTLALTGLTTQVAYVYFAVRGS